jgi:hypothetical protein
MIQSYPNGRIILERRSNRTFIKFPEGQLVIVDGIVVGSALSLLVRRFRF